MVSKSDQIIADDHFEISDTESVNSDNESVDEYDAYLALRFIIPQKREIKALKFGLYVMLRICLNQII